MKKNFIFIILDGCRYDAFNLANTPNFDKIGVAHKCYSPSHWSLPSVMSYLLGEAPLGCPREWRSNLFDFRWDTRDEYSTFKHKDKFCGMYITEWAEGFYDMLGFESIINDYFKFDKIYATNGEKRGYESRDIFEEVVNDINNRKQDGFRIYAHLEETLNPYGLTREQVAHTPIDFQLKCMKDGAERADKNFGYLIDNINEPARIIITADHGELIGDKYGLRELRGHGASMGRVEFHPKLFEIPLIVGDIN